MKAIPEEWNLVIAGAWNVAIFSPPWVASLFKELLNAKQIQIETRLGHAGAIEIRYSDEHLILLPAPTRLTISLKDFSETTMKRAENMARHLLEKLPHTPVIGFGINFGFAEDAPTDTILDLFKLADENRLSNSNYRVDSTTLVRAIQVEDAILSASFTLKNREQLLDISMNFHHGITDTGKAAQILPNRMQWCKIFAITLLAKVYHLSPEEKGGEQ